jgi:hypothetical protein
MARRGRSTFIRSGRKSRAQAPDFKKDLVESMTNSLENITEMNRKFEDMKKEFFYEINTQGKYHIMKEKMKKSIVRIVREHFKRDDPSFRGLTKD